MRSCNWRWRGICATKGESSTDARNIAIQWGVLLREQGRIDEAFALFSRLSEAARRTLGPGHERTQRFAGEVVRTLVAGGAFVEAEVALEDARTAVPEGKRPSEALVDAAVVLYTARERFEPSPANAEAIARWRTTRP